MKLGDIIIKVNNIEVNSQSAFEEELSFHNPGEKLTFTYLRNGKQNTANITLVNFNGTTELIKRKIYDDATIGAQLEANQYGVKVFKIRENSILKGIGVPENFTVIAINRQRVSKPEEIIEFFQKFKGRGYLYGVNSSKQQVEIPFVIR
jgi:PDZ domain-containing secreted protein